MIGDVFVVDGDAPAVLDPVGDVALPDEALPDADVARELRVEDLQRLARAVAMRGRVDRRHAADAEQRIEAPLVVDRRPYARARTSFLVPSAER